MIDYLYFVTLYPEFSQSVSEELFSAYLIRSTSSIESFDKWFPDNEAKGKVAIACLVAYYAWQFQNPNGAIRRYETKFDKIEYQNGQSKNPYQDCLDGFIEDYNVEFGSGYGVSVAGSIYDWGECLNLGLGNPSHLYHMGDFSRY